MRSLAGGRLAAKRVILGSENFYETLNDAKLQ
jgi:hypothetical protein